MLTVTVFEKQLLKTAHFYVSLCKRIGINKKKLQKHINASIYKLWWLNKMKKKRQFQGTKDSLLSVARDREQSWRWRVASALGDKFQLCSYPLFTLGSARDLNA